jgi:hypothetical protein
MAPRERWTDVIAGPIDPVLPCAAASVKTPHISVSTLVADAETIFIAAPLVHRNPHRPDSAMIGAAKKSVNANIRQS